MKKERRIKQKPYIDKPVNPAGETAVQTAFKAVVKAVMNKQVQVMAKGESFPCMIPGSLAAEKNDLCTGDFVKVGRIGKDQYKLLGILPRDNGVYRGNRRSGGEDIIIAANVQILVAVVTAEYLLNQAGYLESAIIAAGRANIKIGIYISKWDRIGEQAQNLLEEKMSMYKRMACFVTAGAAADICQTEILAAVTGKTALVIGERGCGKTSFIRNYLGITAGADAAGTAPVSTHMCTLESGADHTFWIDTPGFRDFALSYITEEERNVVFPEIAELSEHCYFGNCTHVHEEGCEVIRAVKNRQIIRERYDAYQKMRGPAAAGFKREPKIDYRNNACKESFTCSVCGAIVLPDGAGSRHRNHCPKCLSSIHVDVEPGDRNSLCHGIMEPVSVWVRKNGEWALIHRCKDCGTLSSNRIAADDNPTMLLSIAVKPLAMPPFPLDKIETER